MKLSEFCYENYDGRKIVIYGTNDMAYITTYCMDRLGIPVYCYANRKIKLLGIQPKLYFDVITTSF